jgi:hypothetical protein
MMLVGGELEKLASASLPIERRFSMKAWARLRFSGLSAARGDGS